MANFVLTGFGDEISPELDIQLKELKNNGIRYIELRNISGKPVTGLPKAQVLEIKEKLRTEGMKISSIASPIGKVSIEDDFSAHFEQFKHALDVALTLEAPSMRVFSFYLPRDKKAGDYRNEVIDRLGAFCREANACGMRVLHENELGLYGDIPERCLDLVETLGYKNLGLIFDPANFVTHEDTIEPYPYAFNRLKKYTEYIHIKDAIHEGHVITPPGMGEAHIAEILTALHQSGYNGFVSLEPHLGYFEGFDSLEQRPVDPNMPMGGPETFKKAADCLKKIIEKVKAAGEKTAVCPR